MNIMRTLTINGTTYNVTPVVPASSVTLLAAAWTGNGDAYAQVVELPGVTANTKVDLQPTPEQLEEFHYLTLAFVAENENGVVTVYAIGDKPTSDHTIQTTLTEVEAAGKIRGNTVGTTMPRPDWDQTDPTKADYILNKPVVVKSVNDITPDENGNVEVEAGGVTDAEKSLILTLFRNAAYTAPNMADTLAQLEELWSGGEEPDEPVNPEVTLTSISVVYSGGDVAVGTAVTDLTGVSVTAYYSDGSTATVTDYTLSGTIAEGENTITVSYQGKTATFTVNGIAESTGENNGWIDGQAYELNKVDCLKLDTTTGETTEAESGTMVTDFLPCLGVSAVSYEAFDSASILNSVMYDENKNFIKANGLLPVADPTQDNANTYLVLYNVVPEGTAYLRFTQRSSIKYLTSVTPHKYPVLTETTERETGRWYESGAVLGSLNANDGTIVVDGTWYVTGHCMVYGASKVHFSQGTRKTVVFYDGNKNYISGTTINNTTTFEIPENAVYMAASSVDMNNLHIWLEV